MSAPIVNTVLIIIGRPQDIKEPSPKSEEVPTEVTDEGKVGGSVSGDVLMVTRTQEKAQEGVIKEVKGRPTTLDWDAQEKVRSTVGEWVKETPPVLNRPSTEEEVSVTESGVKVAGRLQGQ